MRSLKYLPAALSLFSAGTWANPDPDKDVWVVVTKTNTVTVCPITHWDTCDNWPTFPPNPTTSQPPNGVTTTTRSWSWTSTPSSSSTSTTTLSGPVVSTSTTSTTWHSSTSSTSTGSTFSTSSGSTSSTSLGSTSSTSSGSTSSTSSGSTSSTSSGSTSSTTSGSTSSTSSGTTSNTSSQSTTSTTTTSSSAPVVTDCVSGLQSGTTQCYNVQCGYFANGISGSSQNKVTASVGECVAYCVSINAPHGCTYSYGECMVLSTSPIADNIGNADDSVDYALILPTSCGSSTTTTTTTTTGSTSTPSTSLASTSTTSESTSLTSASTSTTSESTSITTTTTTSNDGGSTTTSSSTSTTTTSGGGPGWTFPEGFFFLTFYTPGSRKMAKRTNYYFAFDDQGYSEVVTSQAEAAVFTISNGYLFNQDSESYVGIFGNQLGLHVAQANAVTVHVGNNGTITIPGASNFCYVFSGLYFDISSYEGSTCEPLVLGVASDPNPVTTTTSSTTTESTSVFTSTSTVTVSVSTSSTTTSDYGYANGTTTTTTSGDPSSTTTTSSYLGYNGTTTTTTTSGFGYNDTATTTTTSGFGYNATTTTTTAAVFNGTTTTSYTTTTSLNTTSTCNNATHTATSLPDVCNSPGSRSTWCDGMTVGSDTLQPYLTGQTKYFTLTITNTTSGWNGLTTFDFAINGQNPGPLIELNWGDVAVVTVINQLQDNATTIHWHGVRQFGTNDQDGVPGITECGIAPGSSRTYTWLASTYGTSWYHSHTLSQYGGGIRGPIIIHGPTTADYDLDLGQIMIEDVYNGPFMAVAALAARTAGAPPIAINYLLNGQNLGPDGVSGANPKWVLKAGKKHLIRIINSSAQGSYIVHLDGHTFTVVSADFTPIVPYQTQNLYIQSGQRYMVIVEADQTPSAYFFRAITQAGCAVPNVNSGLGINNGIFEYETSCGVSPSNAFANGTLPFNLGECQDELLSNLVPYVSETAGDASQFSATAETLPAGNADAAFYAEYGLIVRWYFGGPGVNATDRLIANYTQPTLQTLAQVGAPYNSSIYSNAVVLDGPVNGWVYFVIQNPFRTSHPIHLHGHDFSVLGQGKGFFDSSMVGQLNFANPIRRDTALLYGTLANPSGWTVIGFQTNNPGAWLMHCHIIWHADGGMALQYIEHPEAISADQYYSTGAFQDECSALQTYEAQGAFRLPESFSSGIKKRRHDFNAHAHIDSHIMHAAHRDVVRHI